GHFPPPAVHCNPAEPEGPGLCPWHRAAGRSGGGSLSGGLLDDPDPDRIRLDQPRRHGRWHGRSGPPSPAGPTVRRRGSIDLLGDHDRITADRADLTGCSCLASYVIFRPFPIAGNDIAPIAGNDGGDAVTVTGLRR